jgi:Tfp pilus assembly protein PilE
MRRLVQRDERGFTLVEAALTCLVMAIAMAAAFPTVPLFFSESNVVQNTYSSVDQLVLTSEVATRYIHEAVAPGPAVNPFASAGANAATFYANTGNANGPDKVVIQVTSTATARTFSLDLYPPTANSCPGISSGSACAYTTSTQSLLLINYLTNGTATNPVFTYTLQGGSTCAGPPPGSGGTTLRTALASGNTYTSLAVNALTNPVSSGDTIVVGTGASAQSATASGNAAVGATSIPVSSFRPTTNFASGTSVFDNVCSAAQDGEIEAVSMSLLATKNPGGQPTGYQTMAYLFSPAYNAAVG